MYVNGYKLKLSILHTLLFLCVSLLMVAAALSGATAVQAASASGGPFSFTVSSTLGWQKTPLSVTKGQSYTVSYISGSWTVDYRNFPQVGPAGYSNSVDQTIYQGCKYDPRSNYAVLLGSISGSSSPDFPVSQGGRFTAASSGVLQLRINDDDACLSDNAGSVTMYIGSVIQDKPSTYAGYSIYAGSSGDFTLVEATWVVPQVQCPSSPPYPRAAAWVGLWGTDTTINAGTAWLPQIGTVSQCNILGTPYQPFWEMATGSNVSGGGAQGYGSGPQPIKSMSVGPGDKVFGSVEYEGMSASGNDLIFKLLLIDETRNTPQSPDQFEITVTTTRPVPFDNIMHQGGGIVEGVCGGGGLAQFTPVQFTDVLAASSPYPGVTQPKGTGLNEWYMTKTDGTLLASPGPLSGFPNLMRHTVTYRAGGQPYC